MPIIVIHRVNTVSSLSLIPSRYGVEVDVRYDVGKGALYLNHDTGPLGVHCDTLDEYLSHYNHRFIIFNIKEAGTEDRCRALAEKYGIPKDRYFLLDVEFPYFYRASRTEGVRELAVRYSEAEPIEFALEQKKFVDWVWVDTNTKLPLDADVSRKLAGFKVALVSPDRWGRPGDIPVYRRAVEAAQLPLSVVMCSLEHSSLWE